MHTTTVPAELAQPPATNAFHRMRQWVPGLALTGLLAGVSMQLSKIGWLQANGVSALTLAIVLGMLVGNTAYPRLSAKAGAGVRFSKANLLRLGIILYGLRLTFQDIGNVGWTGVAIDATVLCSTFGLACFLGVRVFGLDRNTAMLIGAGSSICGAAAVMATEPVVRGRAEQVMVAVATVVVFGTLAMFLYPALYHLIAHYRWFDLSPTEYGMFAGSTIHEVAQVVAAGRAGSEQAANTAVIAKMVRVMMLAPFLVGLSAYLSRADGRHAEALDSDRGNATQRSGILIPWFALGFVAVAGLNSLALLPHALVQQVIDIDTVLLAMAMAGLGLTTHVSAIRTAGMKPLALAAIVFAWLVCGGFAINAGITALLN
ncbi:membrane protein [Xanthomonas vasicola pv. vasculorum NCPPB 895]|uniref:YeiH family protein n=1 Tax=Xanthomonas vasicola TaxID=56459 RepID=UPI00034D112A|nr:YeiH family protein [Xanthomonas vasicola]KEZ97747.1 membrane protein [Xanthomonas vasicola pv. vasculorum NCPPB 895]MBV7305348.1 YeiH family protein [Xanthomonas vasicola pv. vasculorum]MDO6933952.1 YeiH family protein [Xanthomonas vasicola]MDO6937538.1 YeiH family protein [Xanthomonas vasicola]